MTDHYDIVEHNPIVFVKAITQAIALGFRVHNTMPGYPQFGAYGNTIRLFKGEAPSGVILPTEFTGLVEQYDPMHFVLAIQTAVDAGYTFKDGAGHYFDVQGLKSVHMERVEAQPETPKAKTPAKKALKAE